MTLITENSEVKRIIERFYKAFSTNDIALLRQVVTDDWEYIPALAGSMSGPEQMREVFGQITAALPDMNINLLDVLVHGDRVGVRAEVTGTQTGNLLGIAATSKVIRFDIHSFHELRGSLVAKTWHLEDWLSIFRQLGELPPASSLLTDGM